MDETLNVILSASAVISWGLAYIAALYTTRINSTPTVPNGERRSGIELELNGPKFYNPLEIVLNNKTPYYSLEQVINW